MVINTLPAKKSPKIKRAFICYKNFCLKDKKLLKPNETTQLMFCEKYGNFHFNEKKKFKIYIERFFSSLKFAKTKKICEWVKETKISDGRTEETIKKITIFERMRYISHDRFGKSELYYYLSGKNKLQDKIFDKVIFRYVEIAAK